MLGLIRFYLHKSFENSESKPNRLYRSSENSLKSKVKSFALLRSESDHRTFGSEASALLIDSIGLSKQLLIGQYSGQHSTFSTQHSIQRFGSIKVVLRISFNLIIRRKLFTNYRPLRFMKIIGNLKTLIGRLISMRHERVDCTL